MEHKFIVSASPHIHTKDTVSSIMLDVIIALLPATIFGIYLFGISSALVVLTAVCTCVLSEFLFNKIMKRKNTVPDLSCIVTGLLLGLNMPPTIPVWMVVVGGVFSIVIVKMLYGGIGKNFVNPALAGRCFMLAAWAGTMTTFVQPFNRTIDAVSSATPLGVMSGVSQGTFPKLVDSFFGITSGCIGETSAFLLLMGGIYLVVRKVITPRIPLIYILTFFVLEFLLGKNTTELARFDFTLMQTLSGGIFLGAIFMATDYTTSPTTKWGQAIFAFGCGLMTFLIRNFGGYPEGVSFSILLMNILTPLIERFTIPKKYGFVKEKK